MFGKDKQSAGHDAQPVSGEKINKKDLPLLNDLQAAMQHEKHRGMFWTISLLAVFLLVFVVWAYFSSVEEVARAIHGDDEMQGEAFSPWDRMPDANRGAYRSNAKAVLDLITSRASTWVPQQPQPIVLPSVEDASRRIRETKSSPSG